MSTALIGKLLPSQRFLLARYYRDIAAAYRNGFPLPELEEAARIADMTAQTFERGRDEPMTAGIDRSDHVERRT